MFKNYWMQLLSVTLVIKVSLCSKLDCLNLRKITLLTFPQRMMPLKKLRADKPLSGPKGYFPRWQLIKAGQRCPTISLKQEKWDRKFNNYWPDKERTVVCTKSQTSLTGGSKIIIPHHSTGIKLLAVLLPGKSHGQKSLVGCSPWGHKESDMTEWLHFHFSLSCIGEGNGNPLQCSCLENPRDGRAWWAAIYGVPQSQTRLKWLSSSSNILKNYTINESILGETVAKL